MTENTFHVEGLPAELTFITLDNTVAIAAPDEDFDEPIEIEFPADAPPNGPAFSPEQEPVAAGTTYQSLSGTSYYRPVWRIPDRDESWVAGPNVWFQKDDRGAISLVWTLVDKPPQGAPDGAKSLAKSIDSVTVRWNGGSQKFPRPRLGRRMNPGSREPWTVLNLGAALLPDDARKLELAMSDASSGCHLEIVHTAHYLIQRPHRPPQPPRMIVVSDGMAESFYQLDRIAASSQFVEIDGARWFVVMINSLADPNDVRAILAKNGVDWPREEDLTRWAPQLIQALGETNFYEHSGLQAPPDSIASPQETQSIPFVFNPNDDANRLIYRVLHGAADLSAEWRRSSAGWLRDSGFPDTVYRLPDELRLAFDPDLGTPHVVVTLHKDDAGSTSVRVLLRIAPWQDPRKVLETRELVGSDSARVIAGPVPQATVRLGGSFPESVKVVGGDADLPLPEGGDLLLELSLEYFQLLTGMLGGAVGLPGEVTVTLGEGLTAPIPVSLRMDKVHDLPVGIDVIGSGSPTSVRVTNRSGTAIRLGGCHGVLLQIDENSVIPAASYQARCTTAFPLELAKDASAELTFEPVGLPTGAQWNAVLVEMLDKMLVDDAKTLLRRANELAGSGELTWDVTISSPVFPALPPQWANLTSLEVEVSAPGFTTTTVVVRKETPARKLTMRKPLSELLTGGAAGIQTATYRVRNNYVDHQGQWTALQEQSGEELIVYPNSTPGD